jgi:hypothetical protein
MATFDCLVVVISKITNIISEQSTMYYGLIFITLIVNDIIYSQELA